MRRRNILKSVFKRHVVIVGGGIAGLTAARTIEDHNQTSEMPPITFRVLEARSKIGGRITQVHPPRGSKGLPVDGGAEFIHNSPRSYLIHEYRRRYGMDTVFDTVEEEYTAIDGRMTQDSEILPSDELLHAVRMAAYDFLHRGGQDMSIKDFIVRVPNLSEDERRILRSLIQSEWFANIEDLSVRGFLKHDFCGYSPGNRRIRQGYGGLLKAMSADFQDRISLNEPVTSMKQSRTGVHVQSASGVTRGRVAIAALPLGVLQAGIVRFTPKLPPEKLEAIHSMNAGKVAKIILWFREKFWQEPLSILRTTSNIQICWQPNAYRGDKANVLAALVGGDDADALGTEKQAIEYFVNQLTQMFGVDVRSLLIRGSMFRPHNDPYIRTGYSSFKATTPADAYERIQRPFDRIFFAGEACSDLSPTTVGGAMLSGERAAKDAIDMIRQYG